MTEVLPTIVTFRDRMRERWSPAWLAASKPDGSPGNNERLMYAISIHADAMATSLIAAVASRFPGVYSYESLPVIGRERRIARGPYESDVSYAARLRRWLNDHRRRGNAYTLLAQIHAYYRPNAFPIELVYRSGRYFAMSASGTVTRSIRPTFSINTDPARYAQWWMFYATDEYEIAPDGTLSSEDIGDLAHVPREWNAAHCIGTIIIMRPGGELWNWPLGRKWNRPGVKWNNPNGRRAKITIDG